MTIVLGLSYLGASKNPKKEEVCVMSKLQEAYSCLDRHIEQRMHAFRTPGMAVALTDRGKLLRVSTYGVTDLEAQTPVAPDTLFEIGSIGKSFTAIAVLQAYQAGLLDLHAPITDYLPWFRVQSQYEPITIHHLLTHSAGIIGGTDFSPDPRSEVWALRKTEAAFPPGERFHYSEVGYKTLGLVLQEVMGQPYGDIVEANILDPLGMTATEPTITHKIRPCLAKGYRHLYDDRPKHISQPLVPAAWIETDSADGCIASTAEDMARYMRGLLNRGQGPNGPILLEASYGLLTQPMIVEENNWYYGYGLYVFEDEGFAHIGHGGDMPGYAAYMWLDLDNGLGVVVLMTQPDAPGIPFVALELLRAVYLNRPLPPTPPLPDFTCVENAADSAGTYRAGDKTITLTVEGKQLLLKHRSERIVLEGRGDGCFYVNHPDFDRYLLQFGRAANANENTKVIEAFHGPDWYTNDQYIGPRSFEYPQEWDAYLGHYRSHNPWESNFRVIVRKGKLLLVWPSGEEETLAPLGNGEFRVGEEDSSPEHLLFDQVVNDQALRANLSGCDYYRFFTP